MSPVTLVVTRLQWLCPHTFEVCFERPAGFEFIPGQKVDISFKNGIRTYTLINALDDDHLSICVRHVDQGQFSPLLSYAKAGDRYQVTPAYGYFAYQPSQLPGIFVATGTGIAPFVSFARSGAKGFHVLHGVRSAEQLYYRELFEKAAIKYHPCLSGENLPTPSLPYGFQGRVTEYMQHSLDEGAYDFYICGRSEMIADAIQIIDQRFEGSKVFTETFY